MSRIVLLIYIFGFINTELFAAWWNPCDWSRCDLNEKWGCDLDDKGNKTDKCSVNRSDQVSKSCPPYNRGSMCPSRPGCLKQFGYPDSFGGNWAMSNIAAAAVGSLIASSQVTLQNTLKTLLQVAKTSSKYSGGTILSLLLEKIGLDPTLYDACAQSVVSDAFLTSSAAEEYYFNPKIQVYFQTRAPEAYFYKSKTLGVGECDMIFSGYLLSPIARYCARIAVAPQSGPPKPGKSIFGISIQAPVGDPGYTYKTHVDDEGVTRPDPIMKDDLGNVIDVDLAKLCAYEDPGLVDTTLAIVVSGILGIDAFDFNPYEQHFHSNAGAHPIIKFMISLIDAGIDLYIMFTNYSFAMTLFDAVGLGQIARKAISFVLKLLGKFAGIILQILGQLNRIVTIESLGCVNIPLGPFPCRYCSRIEGFAPGIAVQKLCAIGTDGFIEEPNGQNKCALSTSIDNDAIKNGLRVGFEFPIQLCTPTSATGYCVKLVGALDAYTGHFVNKDTIYTCGSGAVTGCLDPVSVAAVCNTINLNPCPTKFRLMYGYKFRGNFITEGVPYYTSDQNAVNIRNTQKKALSSLSKFYYTPNQYDNICSSDFTQTDCTQSIWGVNFLDYKDFSINFNSVNQSTASASTSLSYGSSTYNVTAKIALDDEEKSQQICIFMNNQTEPVSCIPRAPVPSPILSDASGSTHFNPLMQASIQIQPRDSLANDSSLRSLSATIGVKNSTNYNLISSSSQDTFFKPYMLGNVSIDRVNFAGTMFEAQVTDNAFKVKPYKPTNCGIQYDGDDLWCGTYFNNVMPIQSIDQNGITFNKDSIYTGGLEYFTYYNKGGLYLCLGSIKKSNCVYNKEDCVLAKKVTIGNSSSGTPQKIVSKNPNDRIIPAAGVSNIANIKYDDSALYTTCQNFISSSYGISVNNCSQSTINSQSLISLTFNPTYNNFQYACNMLLFDANIPANLSTFDASKINFVLQSKQFFDVDPGTSYKTAKTFKGCYSVDINSADMGLRDKTPIEMGSCISVPQQPGQCVVYSNEGNASWTSAAVGSMSTGTCVTSYTPKSGSSLQRYCGLDSNNQPKLQAMNDSLGCKYDPPIGTIRVTIGAVSYSEPGELRTESYIPYNNYSDILNDPYSLKFGGWGAILPIYYNNAKTDLVPDWCTSDQACFITAAKMCETPWGAPWPYVCESDIAYLADPSFSSSGSVLYDLNFVTPENDTTGYYEARTVNINIKNMSGLAWVKAYAYFEPSTDFKWGGWWTEADHKVHIVYTRNNYYNKNDNGDCLVENPVYPWSNNIPGTPWYRDPNTCTNSVFFRNKVMNSYDISSITKYFPDASIITADGENRQILIEDGQTMRQDPYFGWWYMGGTYYFFKHLKQLDIDFKEGDNIISIMYPTSFEWYRRYYTYFAARLIIVIRWQQVCWWC